MTTLIDHTLHCPCCGQTESIHGFTCRCTWQWCPRCYKCLVHCECGTAINSANKITDLLQSVVRRGMIAEVKSRFTKGGCCDNYVSYRRGGCSRAEAFARNRSENAAQRIDARPTVW